MITLVAMLQKGETSIGNVVYVQNGEGSSKV